MPGTQPPGTGSTLSEMTKASLDVELGGKTYHLAPIGLRELGQFEQWVDDHPIRRARRNLEGLPENVQIALMNRALDKSDEPFITATNPEQMGRDQIARQTKIISQMNTIDGMVYLIWLALRPNHPELSIEETYGLVPAGDRDYLTALVDRISGFVNPTKAGRGKKKKGDK